jgi:hypothetical protein
LRQEMKYALPLLLGIIAMVSGLSAPLLFSAATNTSERDKRDDKRFFIEKGFIEKRCVDCLWWFLVVFVSIENESCGYFWFIFEV